MKNKERWTEVLTLEFEKSGVLSSPGWKGREKSKKSKDHKSLKGSVILRLPNLFNMYMRKEGEPGKQSHMKRVEIFECGQQKPQDF